MSEALLRSRDATPPADAEAERLFLGALLVADQEDRNRATLLVKPDAFHDPFHEWLFRGLRQARACSIVVELLDFLAHEVDRPQWIGRNFAAWCAGLLCRRDGKLERCEVRHLRVYAERINRTHRRRERIAELEGELLTLIFDPTTECGHDGTNV